MLLLFQSCFDFVFFSFSLMGLHLGNWGVKSEEKKKKKEWTVLIFQGVIWG
jgi:hypothetical protein